MGDELHAPKMTSARNVTGCLLRARDQKTDALKLCHQTPLGLVNGATVTDELDQRWLRGTIGLQLAQKELKDNIFLLCL